MPKISLTATNEEGHTSTGIFEIIPEKEAVAVKFYKEHDSINELIGTITATKEDFRNFCLDLFNEQKKIQ